MADIVLSHHGLKHKIQLSLQIISFIVRPAPEHFRPLLRRLAALGEIDPPPQHGWHHRHQVCCDHDAPSNDLTQFLTGVPSLVNCGVKRHFFVMHQSKDKQNNGAADLTHHVESFLSFKASLGTQRDCLESLRQAHILTLTCDLSGQDSNEVATQAQRLLEHSLLCELHNVVARALSGLDMFEGKQLTEADLCGSDDSQEENKTLSAEV